MQSRFFSITGLKTKELEEDLRALQRLSSEQLSAVQRFLCDGEHLIQTDESMQREVQAFLSKNSVLPEHYARARRLGTFFVNACERYDDEPQAIIDDLNEIVPLGTDLHSFFVGMTGAVLRALQVRRREHLAKRSLPALEAISYVCDLRADLPEFDVFRDDPDNRSGKARAWLALALIRFSTDEDDELRCQVDLERLRRAINVLRAAERDLLQIHGQCVAAGLIEKAEG